MLTADGRVKVLDFGLAKFISPSELTKSNVAMGTAYYQAPEQGVHLRESDHRADIYSVGVILYQLITGKVPVGRLKKPSQLVPNVPAELDEVILKCLEPEPIVYRSFCK